MRCRLCLRHWVVTLGCECWVARVRAAAVAMRARCEHACRVHGAGAPGRFVDEAAVRTFGVELRRRAAAGAAVPQ
eukprot:5518745-Pyramimonas_sp.AAC.1